MLVITIWAIYIKKGKDFLSSIIAFCFCPSPQTNVATYVLCLLCKHLDLDKWREKNLRKLLR